MYKSHRWQNSEDPHYTEIIQAETVTEAPPLKMQEKVLFSLWSGSMSPLLGLGRICSDCDQ